MHILIELKEDRESNLIPEQLVKLERSFKDQTQAFFCILFIS